MSSVTVLEAVPMQDNIHIQDLQTFEDDQGRNYSYMFNFEQEFEHSVVRVWMEENWRPVCAWASGIYLLLIFGGQLIMTNRQPFQLRGPLVAWNIMLAVFSITGAARTFPEFIYTFSTQGFHHSLCVPSFIERDRVSGFWTWMFVLSKVPELGDTIFIVLRKQRLIFLHWYHHVTVLIYCWYSFSEYTAPARWFVVMNFTVHSLMYTYYAFRALRFRIPKYVAMVITTLQLVQMVVGCLVNYIAYTLKKRGVECGVSNTNLKMSLLMYTSYFVLFARFFYNTYFRRRETGMKVEEKIKQIKKEECERLIEEKEPEQTLRNVEPKPEVAAEKIATPNNCNGNITTEDDKSSKDKNKNIQSNEDVEHLDNDQNIEGTKITASSCEGKINKHRNEAMKSDKKEEKEITNHNQENNQKQMVIEGQEFETTQNKETQRI